jgi:hypothetical protein
MMLTFMTDMQKLKRVGHIRTCTRTNTHTGELNIQQAKRKTIGIRYFNKYFCQESMQRAFNNTKHTQ